MPKYALMIFLTIVVSQEDSSLTYHPGSLNPLPRLAVYVLVADRIHSTADGSEHVLKSMPDARSSRYP